MLRRSPNRSRLTNVVVCMWHRQTVGSGLATWRAEWLDSKHKLKRSTRARYESTLTVTLADFHRVAIGDITRPMVRALVADLVNGGAAPSSVHKTVGLLRQVLATAVADNLIAANPAEGVELPTVRMTEQRFLTGAELHRLALAAGEHMPLVYVLGTTGLRFGEAAELRWRDVDFAGLRLRITRSMTFVNGQPVVGPPKNGKHRTVALPATVAGMLTPGADDDLVFADSARWVDAGQQCAPPLVGQSTGRRRATG